jgi:ABC-type transporter MlaC component
MRYLKTLLVTIFVLCATPSPSMASELYVRTAITEIIEKARNNTRQNFKPSLAKYIDMTRLSQSVIGVSWRGMSVSQKSSFISGFRIYLNAKYGKMFYKIRNGGVDITGNKPTTRGMIVNSAWILGAKVIEVDWDIRNEQLYDVIIEGTSLRITETKIIRDVLEKTRDIDELIDRLDTLG